MNDISSGSLKSILVSKRANVYFLEHVAWLMKFTRGRACGWCRRRAVFDYRLCDEVVLYRVPNAAISQVLVIPVDHQRGNVIFRGFAKQREL